jgi:fused signal recognition particle receptor
MFKSLREKLAAWRQKAEAEVEPEAEGDATPDTEPAPASRTASASRSASAPRPAPSARVIGDSGRKLKEDKLEEILYDLEMALLESDVAFPVAKEVVDTLAEELRGKRVAREVSIEVGVEAALRDAITEAMTVPTIDLFEIVKTHPKPVVIMFVGVNGTGKTTTIAKLAYHIQKKGYTAVVAAADTFRAGAIEQLEKHAEAVGFKLVRHEAGSDPAAVAYDAVEHARARKRDVVLIDTAGRMQTNTNLMDQMKKIKRVASPDLIFYIGDALAGNDAIEQAKEFNAAVGIDGIVLTKIDADAKGGAALSIAHTIGKPIVFVSTGQGYEDIRRFNVQWMVDRLLSPEEKEA